MDSLLRYMQAPNPGEEPTCRLMIVKDKAKSTMVSLFINRPIQQQEDLTIEYGGPYWQIFWNHLSLDQQRQIKIQYPDITFPPHWPQAIPSGHRSQKISNQLKSDYSLAARNIYDVLDTLDQQDEGDQERDDEDDRSTGAPSQVTHPKPAPSNPATNPTATCRSPSPKMGKARPNTSKIAMLNPSRHIFRDWTPLPFSVHEDVGLEVGKEFIRKIAGALGHPMPAAPSSKDSHEMMMDKLWRTHGLDEVE
jgi:hypothetical protein